MKLKTLFLISFFTLLFMTTFAQNRILTTDGKTLHAASVEVNKENINAAIDGENQTILKSNILIVVPDGKKGYTFRIKNGQKLKIRKRGINNNYQGTDIPKVYAYKYLGSQGDIQQMYITYSDTSISYEEFKTIFKKQQKKIKTGNIVSISASAFILLIALGVGI